MRGWSMSLGRYFGVEVRLHALFVLLLPATVMLSAALSGVVFRGFVLWLLLLAAVIVREVGRSLAYTVAGAPMSRLLLLPTGSAPPLEDTAPLSPGKERLLALAGPLSNFFAGITMALLMYSATARVNLFERPWFGPQHLLRSAIWCQVLLGGLNLLPAFPLDAGVLLRKQFRKIRGTVAGTRSAAGISQMTATILILLGAGTQNAWLVIMGCSVLLTSRADAVTALASSAAESVVVSEIMLTEYTTLSASDTLEDALRRTVQSLQDVFPVVRGPMIVGAVSRDALLLALRTDGNGYVQGAMTRTVETIAPNDLLLPALRRVQRRDGNGAQLMPVVSDEAVVGIVTPGNLAHSMGVLGRTRRVLSRTAPAGRDA